MPTTLKNTSGHPLGFIVPGGRSIDVDKGGVITLTDAELDALTDPKCKWGGELLNSFEAVRTPPKSKPEPEPTKDAK